MAGRETNRVLRVGRVAVVKVYPQPWRGQTEAAALRMLAGTGLAPRPLGSVPLRGRSATLTRYVRGRAPSVRSDADVRLAALALREVHRFPGPGHGRLHAPTAPTWAAFLDARLRSYAEILARVGHEQAAECCGHVRARLHVLGDPRPRLLHGDPNPSNVLIRRGRAVLLDWELATFGDPLLDLVRLAWEWQVPPDDWAPLVGCEPSDPAVTAYRHIHVLSRLMSASLRHGPAAAARARRCLAELREYA